MFGKWMRAREIAHTKKDDNRIVRPFAWGADFISDHVNGDDPRVLFREKITTFPLGAGNWNWSCAKSALATFSPFSLSSGFQATNLKNENIYRQRFSAI